MGKLLDVLKNKLTTIREELGKQVPDASVDAKAAVEAVRRRNELRYIERVIGAQLNQALKDLPVEKQDEFYDRCIQEDAKAKFTREQFRSQVNNLETGSCLIQNADFGQNWEKTIETLEEMVGEETARKTADAVEKVIAPNSPQFPQESKLRYVYQNQINTAKNRVNANAPDAQQTKEFLDQVNEHLASPTAEMSHFIDEMDHEMKPAAEKSLYGSIHRFFEGETGQKYVGKIPSQKFTGIEYSIPTPEAISERHSLSDDDIEEMKSIHPVISNETKKEIIDVTNLMDQLGEANFINSSTAKKAAIDADENLFVAEQGTKNYAFWPLVNHREQLTKAVASGNIDNIKNADREYMQAKKITDQMMDIVKKNPSPICAGNINSTRIVNDAPSPIPLEYQEDFVSHSKLNGMFLMYALSKNTGKSVQELLEKPVQSMTDAGKNYSQKYGLNSRKTVEDKLVSALNENESEAFKGTWTNCYAFMGTRAFSGAAAMGRTQEESDQLNGAAHLAVAAATRPVNIQADLWESLQTIGEDKRNILYQHALLLDDDAFDPLQYAAEFKKPGWKKDLSTENLIQKLKQENKLNVDRIADRIDSIREKAAQTKEFIDENNIKPLTFKGKEFDEAAIKLSRDILRNATAEEKKTEPYIKLQEKMDRMTVEANQEEFKKLENDLQKNLNVQGKAKKGFLLSSTNTKEHQMMTASQQMVKWKLRMLRGDDMSDVDPKMQELIRKTALSTLVNNSRDLTFTYCAEKTDNGRKNTFTHGIGKERFDSARSSINTLDKIVKKAGTKTPAHYYMDEKRLEALDNRHDPEWVERYAADSTVRVMYAMTVDFKHKDPSKQERYMEEDRMVRQCKTLLKDSAVKRVAEEIDDDKLIDNLIKGHGSITNSYIQTKNEIAKEKGKEPGKGYKEMTPQERGEMWASKAPI